MVSCCRSMDSKEERIPLGEAETYGMDASYDPTHPFGEDPSSFDEKFWQDVKDTKESKNVDRVTALRLVRVSRLEKNCDTDVLVDLIKNKYDNYYAYCEKQESFDMFQTFVFELSQLAEVILKEDFKRAEPKYLLERHILPNKTRVNIIHLAAERNLTDIMDLLLNKQDGLVNVETYPDNKKPLHYALDKFNDEAAAKLIKYMSHESVRYLFGDHDNDTEEWPTFKLADYITRGDMKETVVAVLDCLMNPDWPFMPVPKEDDEENDGIVLPNLPFRYHFYYRLLDGDYYGLPGRKDNGDIVPEFNSDRKKSCLQLLSEHSTQEDIMIRHPVVRMLMRSKWSRFGKKWIMINCMLYSLFIIAMSVALLSISSTRDRKSYSSGLDYFRLICEIVTLLFTLFFIFAEFSEVYRDRLLYFTDPFNILDTAGLALIIAIVPLRFSNCTTAEFIVSSAAYLINFLRVAKCLMAFKTMSIYMKTIYLILTQDILRFVIMWGLFLMGFTGCVFLAIKANENNAILQEYNNGTYWHVLLQEVRSLAESSGFAETETFHAISVFITILLLVNMFFFLIVFNNILIGQIGSSYNNAVNDAKVQYDIDRIRMVTRIESQAFCMPWYLRRTHYVDKEFLNNSVLEEDLLEDWMLIKKKSEAKEQKKAEIKLHMTNKLKKVEPEKKNE